MPGDVPATGNTPFWSALHHNPLAIERDQGAGKRPAQTRADLAHGVIQRFELGELDRSLIADMGDGAAKKPRRASLRIAPSRSLLARRPAMGAMRVH